MLPRSIGSIAALALLGACGKALPVDEAPIDGSSTTADASSSPPDASPIDGGTCVPVDDGEQLDFEPGKQPHFVRKLTAAADITRSILDLDMNVEIEGGAWNGYFGLVSFGYGDGEDYTSVPVTDLTLTPTLEANVWRAKGTGSQYYTYQDLKPFTLPAGDVHVHVDIRWGSPGALSVSINGATKDVAVATLEAARQRTLTIVLGSGDQGTYPRHRVTLRSLCVRFE